MYVSIGVLHVSRCKRREEKIDTNKRTKTKNYCCYCKGTRGLGYYMYEGVSTCMGIKGKVKL